MTSLTSFFLGDFFSIFLSLCVSPRRKKQSSFFSFPQPSLRAQGLTTYVETKYIVGGRFTKHHAIGLTQPAS